MAAGGLLERSDHLDGFQDWVDRVTAMHHDFRNVVNEAVAWSPPGRPMSQSRVALLTTGGVQPASDPPFDELSPLGDPSYRVVPAGAPGASLAVHHNHYDHSAADRDVNCLFPVDRLRELAAAGSLQLASAHYGFMGFNPNPEGLVASASEVARRLADDGVDVAVLTPG